MFRHYFDLVAKEEDRITSQSHHKPNPTKRIISYQTHRNVVHILVIYLVVFPIFLLVF